MSHETLRKKMQEREITWDQKFSKRSSGLFSVLKWFSNKESVSVASSSESSSCESIESVFSTDTVASFAFVPPNSYKPFGSGLLADKLILSGPETSTYRARLAQREIRRESDRNLTLHSKYNLHKNPEPDRGHSLPLMSKSLNSEEEGMFRSVSESSKHRRSYVKGKRKAPQPPGLKNDNTLRRKKRLAPQPPTVPDVICNDSLKLDHGVLKSAKQHIDAKSNQIQDIIQVSPRPWYKRTLTKSEKKPDQEKRKSGLTFLTNISELDREAMEIVGKESLKLKYLKSMNQAPAFMRPKGNEHTRTNSDSWILPKKKSAKDLIARFNAITGVAKETKEEISLPTIPKSSGQEIQSCSTEKVYKCTAVVKPVARTQWNCPKCTLENDYWRIICKVCSTIKPYFDDFASNSPLKTNKTNENNDNNIEKEIKTAFLSSQNCKLLNITGTSKHKSDDFEILPPENTISKVSTTSDNKNEFFKYNKSEFPGLSTKSPIKVSEISNLADKFYYNNNATSTCKELNTKKDNSANIEKMILGDVLGISIPNYNKETTIKTDSLDIEKPDYVNVEVKNEISTTNKDKVIEKMILGDEMLVKNSENSKAPIVALEIESNNQDIDKSVTQKGNEDKKLSAKKEEREKLKKMLIEMKNSLPKKKCESSQNNENKRRVSLIEEVSEPEIVEKEKSAEIIIATTQTIYENIKIKSNNVNKPVKVSSSSQTNATARCNISTEETAVLQGCSKSFQLLKEKDFVGITNKRTKSDEHTYSNLREDEVKLAEFSKTDTLEINRLLRKLETAIAEGELGHAAIFARELAQLKVPLNVIRQKSEEADKNRNPVDCFKVDMYVEDKISHRGPFPLEVTRDMTILGLKKLVEDKYKIPTKVQRWILGRQLAIDDDATLSAHQITSIGCPIFLYLVDPLDSASEAKIDSDPKTEVNNTALPEASTSNIVYHVPIAIIKDEGDIKENESNNEEIEVQQLWKCNACTLLNILNNTKCEMCGFIRDGVIAKPQTENHTYLQLMNLDNEDLVRNIDMFECLVCLTECPPGEGVTLRECLHQFCRTCLAHTVEFSEEAEIKCPYRDEQYSCDLTLQDREVKALVTNAIYEQHLAKSIKQAENKIDNTFHCKTPDCTGWCIYEDNVNDFHCPVCRKSNCLTCQSIHTGMNCKQYQEKMESQSETDEEARRTRNFLEDMMTRGEALSCPTCQVVLLKKWGCDWLRCSMCKTEICWVTRGPRWGPTGKGDTTAGCKCGVNGIKCHPKCNYCH